MNSSSLLLKIKHPNIKDHTEGDISKTSPVGKRTKSWKTEIAPRANREQKILILMNSQFANFSFYISYFFVF